MNNSLDHLVELAEELWERSTWPSRCYELCLLIEPHDSIRLAAESWTKLFVSLKNGDAPKDAPIKSFTILTSISYLAGKDKYFREDQNRQALIAWAATEAAQLHTSAKTKLLSLNQASIEENAIGGPALRAALYLLAPQDLPFLNPIISVSQTREPYGEVWLHKLAAAAPNIESLDLSGSTGLAARTGPLSQLANLRTLDLSRTDVANPDIAPLSRLDKLEELNLGGTRVTDGVSQYLNQCPALKRLIMPMESASGEAINILNRSLPGVAVETH